MGFELGTRERVFKYLERPSVILNQDSQVVMAGLVPAMSLRKARLCPSYRDRRDKPGDDERE
jgi:hypothetical protein